MRECDRREVRASANACPLQALLHSVQYSTLKWSIKRDDEIIGVFGVGAESMMSSKGAPWLLATPELEFITITFLRQSRDYVGRMLAQHSFLENWVDARNLISIKWLKWCGFKFDEEPVPFGYEQKPFYRFEMRSQLCANP
jgi:hypothetical protein